MKNEIGIASGTHLRVERETSIIICVRLWEMRNVQQQQIAIFLCVEARREMIKLVFLIMSIFLLYLNERRRYFDLTQIKKKLF